jgi:transcriptional regulator with XRE-family HTH domain
VSHGNEQRLRETEKSVKNILRKINKMLSPATANIYDATVHCPVYSERRSDYTPMTLAQRFRLRVAEILEGKGLHQKDLAAEGKDSWVSNKLAGRRGITLQDVEQIAGALNVPPAELVRSPADRVYELRAVEAEIVEAFRKLSDGEQRALLTIATLRLRPPTTKKNPLHSSNTTRFNTVPRLRPLPSSTGGTHDTRTLSPAALEIVAEYEAKLAAQLAIESRQQAPSARRPVADASGSHRGHGRPDAGKVE